MANRDTYEKGEGPAVGFGGSGSQNDTAASQTGAPTPTDNNIEEERQRRQEDWSPAGQTGFDNEDVDRQESIYTDEASSDPEEGRRKSAEG